MNTKQYYSLSLLTALSLSVCFLLASFVDFSMPTVSATESPGGRLKSASVSTLQLATELVVPQNPFDLAFARADKTFVSQVISKYNQTARSDANPNCGPASLVMTTRWLNLPTFQQSNTQAAVDSARLALTGVKDETGIMISAFEQYAKKQNIPIRSLLNIEELKAALTGEVAVVAQGNPFGEWQIRGNNEPKKSYAYRISPEQYGACSTPGFAKGCSHFIVVLASNAADNTFIISDPLRKEGPLVISEAELAAFFGSDFIEARAIG